MSALPIRDAWIRLANESTKLCSSLSRRCSKVDMQSRAMYKRPGAHSLVYAGRVRRVEGCISFDGALINSPSVCPFRPVRAARDGGHKVYRITHAFEQRALELLLVFWQLCQVWCRHFRRMNGAWEASMRYMQNTQICVGSCWVHSLRYCLTS